MAASSSSTGPLVSSGGSDSTSVVVDPQPSAIQGSQSEASSAAFSHLETSAFGTLHAHTGQVFYRRCLNRNCIFWELRVDGSALQDCVTVLVRASDTVSAALMQDCRVVRPGDVVRVEGTSAREEQEQHQQQQQQQQHQPQEPRQQQSGQPVVRRPLLRLTALTLLAKWSERHPKLNFSRFVPLPPCAPELLQAAPQPAGSGAAVGTFPAAAWESSHPPLPPVVGTHRMCCIKEYFQGIPLHELCPHWVTGQHGCRNSRCPLLHTLPSGSEVDFGALKFAFGRWREHNKAEASRTLERKLNSQLQELAEEGGAGAAAAASAAAAVAAADEAAAAAAAAAAASAASQEAGEGTGPSRTCHSMRAFCVVQFLLTSAPPQALLRGVLDVAGGKGDVAHLLALCGIAATTIDPRAVPVESGLASKRRRRKENAFDRRGLAELCLQAFGPAAPQLQLQLQPPVGRQEAAAAAAGLQGEWLGEAEVLDADLMLVGGSPGLEEAQEQEGREQGQGAAAAAAAAATPCSRPYTEPVQVRSLFGRGHFYPSQQECCAWGLALGFHPDQGTEPLLDWVLDRRMPFLIVPCCVFAKEAEAPRVLQGKEVTSYEDFFAYLVHKAKAAGCPVRVTRLALNGRNAALYCWEQW